MAKGLFNRLLALYPSPVPEEDYFTELIAWLFENNHTLLFKWLKENLKLGAPYTGCRIETQVEFEKLEGHETSSRPDILITLFEDQVKDVLMLESKMGAVEGYEQLPRYAEHLSHGFPDARNRYLVFISRVFDPKEAGHVYKFVKNMNIEFKQTRWFEFYQFLLKQPSETILNEVIGFMKEKRMSKITKITPAVLVALNGYPDVYNFFQSVMDDEVNARFIQVIGKKPRSEERRLWNVSEMRRYLMIGDLSDHLIFFIGFLMPDNNDEFPTINAWFQIRPSAPDRHQRIQICKKIINDSMEGALKWKGYNLDDQGDQAGIMLETSFEEIFGEADHILALKRKFLEYIDEFTRILNEYPGLTD